MSYKIDIHPSNTLRIVCIGKLTNEELESMRENAMTIIRMNDLEQICCDLRASTIGGMDFDLLGFASTGRESHQIIKRTAIIYATEKHNLEDLSMYAALANSNGFKVKLFNSRSKALKWLKF